MADTTPKPERIWMIATGVLGVALVVSLVFLFTGDGDESVFSTTTSVIAASTAVPDVGDENGEGEDVVATDAPASNGDEMEMFAVVVDNAPSARPQVGLGGEPLLVEYETEGGITRFVAVVPVGTEGLVGPVRSLRPINAALGPVLASALVTSGGQTDITRQVAASGVTLVTPFEIPSFVSLGRPVPHDTFIDLGDLATFFTPVPQMLGVPFGGEPSAATGEATRVELPFPGVAFSYDPAVGYLREQDGAQFEVLDPLAAETSVLSHDTIVILYAAKRSAGYTDSNDVEVATYDVVGSGDLVVLHGGEVVEGTWSRSAMADPYVFRSETGESFGLPDGRTYLAILSRNQPAEIS